MANIRSPIVYIPKNLQELLTTFHNNPGATLWAGGTAIAGLLKHTLPYKQPGKIISMEMVTEIAKVSRTERFLEIGARVSYNRILQVGQHVLPRPLNQALSQLRPLALRNLATLGGNVAVPNMRLNLYPVLMLLDTRVELRQGAKGRWIDIQRLFDRQGELTLGPGELITRFRIPFEDREIGFFRQIGSPKKDPRCAFVFCSTGNMVKGTISDIRCVLGTYSPNIIRNREMEALLSGKKVPLIKKEREEAAALMEETLGKVSGISTFQRKRSLELVRWFLANLREPE